VQCEPAPSAPSETEASVTPEVGVAAAPGVVVVVTTAPSPAASDTAYNPDLLKELASSRPRMRVVCGMGYKAAPRRRSRFLVCLAPSPTYVGRVSWCAFNSLAPRSGKKMESCAPRWKALSFPRTCGLTPFFPRVEPVPSPHEGSALGTRLDCKATAGNHSLHPRHHSTHK
jgi:hypothetical protein